MSFTDGVLFQLGRMAAPLIVSAAVLVILGIWCVFTYLVGKCKGKW